MEPSWLSLIPPLIVLIGACATRKILLSIGIGIITAGLIATSGAPQKTILLIVQRFYQNVSDKDSIYMYSFLIIIGFIIMLIFASGGICAFARHMKKRFSSKKAVESSSLVLSALVGIDDYLNSITVGHVIQPIAQRFGIARTKLAYLLHAMAGPLVVLVPISSWAAVITTNLDSSGISLETMNTTTKIVADPFYVYIKTIPFIFYSIFTIFSAWYIVHKKISYGPMKKDEKMAQKAAYKTSQETIECNKSNSLYDILIPLSTLLFSVIIGILYTGGYWVLGGNQSLIGAFKNNTQNSLVLLLASLATMLVTILLGFARKKLSHFTVSKAIKDGILLMAPAIVMLIMANTLGNILRFDLFTGDYLAQSFIGALPIMLVPFIFFIITTITALLTGSSWGTIALMLAIAIPMITSMLTTPLPTQMINIPILLPTLGAILSGAVCGDQLSPLSETTIMVSTSAKTTPFAHFFTQIFYAIPALVASTIAFLLSGIYISKKPFINLTISLGFGILICIFLLQLFHILWSKKKKTNLDLKP